MHLHFDVNLNSHNHNTPELEKDTNFFENSKLSQTLKLISSKLFFIQ